MSSGLTDDEMERVESFAETPPYDRSPEDLVPDQRGDDGSDEESDESVLTTVLHLLRRR